MDEQVDTLAARVKIARVNAGLSQTDLANALGVNRSTVGHWERGNGFSPKLEHLEAMCSLVHVSMDWMVHGHVVPRAWERSGTRAALESKMMNLSRHLPMSFLASVVALMESAEPYL